MSERCQTTGERGELCRLPRRHLCPHLYVGEPLTPLQAQAWSQERWARLGLMQRWLRPSHIDLRIPHFVGCAGRAEREFALGLYVRTCQVKADRWQPIVPVEVGEILKDDVEQGRPPWAKLRHNPFWFPDFPDLVAAGYGRWLGEGAGAPFELTAKGWGSIEEWAAACLPAAGP
jgi:hypothetical protein